MDHEEKLALGAKVRAEVLGQKHVNAPGSAPSKFQEAFRQFTVEYCWANVWLRPGLERKTRSLINLAMLAAMARWHEFEVHTRGALNNGVTEEEIIEVILQTGVYAGVPVAAEAMRIAERTINDYRAQPEAK
ncbi:4-carboxymuconolactone decarboxylase [Agaricicola taiwanensis]|uniref:4-carboxymuconolactone decarboxylase n=1 Tax=Agaricicola taiwanensis TaxID=591372 RepID=A0A8J2YKQ7_9RHOB|nr:carboxymuconolactone decarboxylase family protein [Agaricicola taiwanensis]GGE51675.1 4-carboxymuconolactone decarboxylase [Agaricicola taiwanensis]